MTRGRSLPDEKAEETTQRGQCTVLLMEALAWGTSRTLATQQLPEFEMIASFFLNGSASTFFG